MSMQHYLSAEMKSVYSTAPADSAIGAETKTRNKGIIYTSLIV